MDMDEFGMGSPTEAFVLSGNCEVLGLDLVAGSSSGGSAAAPTYEDAYERVESTSSKQFEGSERWSIREMLEDGVYSGVRYAA
ncbi:hypothetical protein Bca101_039320 [Brassica carinata]